MSTANLAEIRTQAEPGERRQHPRVKVAIEAELHVQSGAPALAAQTADLSLDGCYIPLLFTLEVGRMLDVVLTLGDHRLGIRAVVVRRNPRRGNGILFLDMAREDRIRLQNFLKSKLDESGMIGHRTLPAAT